MTVYRIGPEANYTKRPIGLKWPVYVTNPREAFIIATDEGKSQPLFKSVNNSEYVQITAFDLMREIENY